MGKDQPQPLHGMSLHMRTWGRIFFTHMNLDQRTGGEYYVFGGEHVNRYEREEAGVVLQGGGGDATEATQTTTLMSSAR